MTSNELLFLAYTEVERAHRLVKSLVDAAAQSESLPAQQCRTTISDLNSALRTASVAAVTLENEALKA